MKRLLLFFTICSFFTIAQAYQSYPCIFDGFYVGVSLGGMHTIADTEANASAQYVTPPTGISTISNSLSGDISDNSLNGAIFVGYGQQIQQSLFYLGAELFANAASRDLNNHHSASDIITLTDPPFLGIVNPNLATQVILN